MPCGEAEELRRIAMTCQHAAAHCTDPDLAGQLEGLAAELSQQALTLDRLFDQMEKP